MARIFLSHSTEDKPWLIGLVHKLVWLGHDVFIDEPRGVDLPLNKGIPIGESWYKVLERELRAVDKVLAVWSPAAAAKLADGRGKAFAREIFWAAKNRKLVFAYIEQNASASADSDAAFYAAPAPNDLSALYTLLGADEVYKDDPTVREVLGGQRFPIEGTRMGARALAADQGVGRLQREVLAPKKAPIELPDEDLKIAREAIDRKKQLGIVEDLIVEAQDVSPGFANFHVSSDCFPETVLNRLDVGKAYHVPWEPGLNAKSRRRKLDAKLTSVLADPVSRALSGAGPDPMLVYTKIQVGEDVGDWDEAKRMCSEWDEAVAAYTIPPNLPVVFVAILQDHSALGDNADAYIFTDKAWVRFGRVPSTEFINWAESDEVRRLFEENGLASLRDSENRRWTTQEWLHQRLRRLFEGHNGPTMRDARNEAEHLIDQAAQMAAGGGGPTSGDDPIFGGVR